MIQEYITYSIIALSIMYVIYNIYKSLLPSKNKCKCCDLDCKLRNR